MQADSLRTIRRRGIGLACALSFLVGCAGNPPAGNEAVPVEPIRVGRSGSQSLVFQKSLFRIPAGTRFSVTRMRGRVVGEENWGGSSRDSGAFNVTASDELRRLGYDVRDAGDTLFAPTAALEARYQMAAIIHELSIDFEVRLPNGPSTDRFEQVNAFAKMGVEFQLFDAIERELVTKTRVAGEAGASGRNGQPMAGAFLVALRRALADPDFVAPLLASPSPGVAQDGTEREIPVVRCATERLSLPDDLPRAQEAVVVVVVGSTSGTGTLVSENGYVLTAAHVIGAATRATLRFRSGLELPAELVAIDAARDAALLRAPGRGHPCLATQARTVPVGTELWAIGNPIAEELARSVTRGVASGNRMLRGLPYLQTDAAVNPGNSGGPLLDAAGRMRAIVVTKVSDERIEGLGFAVPVGEAESALGLVWRDPADSARRDRSSGPSGSSSPTHRTGRTPVAPLPNAADRPLPGGPDAALPGPR